MHPAMISAAAGSMALVIVSLVRDYGPEYLMAAAVLCGPTNAKDTEYGKIMRNVSIVNGTSGM